MCTIDKCFNRECLSFLVYCMYLHRPLIRERRLGKTHLCDTGHCHCWLNETPFKKWSLGKSAIHIRAANRFTGRGCHNSQDCRGRNGNVRPMARKPEKPGYWNGQTGPIDSPMSKPNSKWAWRSKFESWRAFECRPRLVVTREIDRSQGQKMTRPGREDLAM